jgi:membrane protease YdiL (CAAX protease family)
MFRKPLFWIALVVVAAACSVYTIWMFPSAFSLVNLDLRMDREAALSEARRLADSHGWGPEGYQQAASFSLDDSVQAFVELEGGGQEAFRSMLEGESHAAYRWLVRHFREAETREVLIRFTPTGRPYGFRETLAEDEPGATLESEAAREIAESAARSIWDVELDGLELVESSQETRPGGRTDHSFVYERPDRSLGEGRFRLRLTVSGDRFTELTHFIKIPESFTRRYEEMRAANMGVGAAGSIAMVVLYGIGGIVIGLFLLLRQRAVLWRQALAWGLFIASLQAAVSLNHWPLAWMGYDTALSSTNFTLQQLAQAFVQFFGMGVLLTLSFMAAEGLTRMAFPQHVQLWKLWSRDAAPSPTVLGWTAAGYLLVAPWLAYDVSLYSFAHRTLGWWTPSSALVEPDILATYFPWFDSIAISLQAGFWEEILFRALPIAGAALLGQRFGGRRYWIIGAFVVQALIFGAMHAPYPAQPSYARVVELILPSIFLGLVYLRLGLLPAIVAHFAIDVVLIALPLFTSSAPGIWIQQALVVALILVPLGVVILARLRRGAWGEVPDALRNRGWTPPTAPPLVEEAPPPRRFGLAATARIALIGLGVVGLAAWLLATPFSTDAPSLEVDRDEALAAARAALAEDGFEADDPWREMAVVLAPIRDSDRFVWREGGPEAYDELLGDYLFPPRWWVRYGRFEGDVAERAEEYQAWVDPQGKVFRLHHRLAEATPGPSLEEEAARAIALSVVDATYGLNEPAIEEVSARPSKLPERTDWVFTFKHPDGYSLEQGEARIRVDISGDEVTDTYRFVHVAEEWEREERNRQSLLQILRVMSGIGIAALFGAGAVGAIVRWSRRRFAVRPFLVVFGLLLLLGLVNLFNQWPVVVSNFSTAQPFLLQAGLALGGGLLGLGGLAAVVGLNVGLVHGWLALRPSRHRAVTIVAGLGLGIALVGLISAAGAVVSQDEPLLADYSSAAAGVPFLSASLGPVSAFVVLTAVVLLVLAAIDRFTLGWTRRRGPFFVCFLVIGWLAAGSSANGLVGWLVGGALTGIVLWAAYAFVLRFDPALAPLAAAGLSIFGTLQDGIHGAYPGSFAGSLVAVVLIALVAFVWLRALSGNDEAAAPTDSAPALAARGRP